MKKTLLILLAVIGLCSCKKAPVPVPFEKVEHYYATVDGPVSRKITDQQTFNGMFDVAFSGGTPQAALDFGKEFVIAIINAVTDKQTTLAPVSLVKENGNLVFTYSEQIGGTETYTTRPILLIRVAKQYDAPLQVIKVQK